MSTILLVEDDAAFQAQVLSTFETLGHRVVVAESGAAGDAALEGLRPDLIICDGLLPESDGVTWISGLRARGGKQRVVFVSSFWRDPSYRARLLGELGVLEIVNKPVAQDELARLAGHWLQGRAGGSVAASPARALAQLDEVLARLRRAYLADLPTKLKDLRDAVARLRADPRDPLARGIARTIPHKLRGTAASFGFPELGEAAARVEDAILALEGTILPGEGKPLPEPLQPQALTDEVWASIQRDVEGMASALSGTGGAAPTAPDAPATTAAPAPAPAPATRMSGASIRVLLFDPDPVELRRKDEAARRRYLEAVPVSTREEALAHAVAEPPDVAVIAVDPAAPERAYALAKDLRDAAPGPLPLILDSPTGDVADRVAAAHAGASLVLTRPVAEAALDAAVRRLAEAGGGARRPSVLVIDDDETFSALVRALLERAGLRVSTLADPARALEALEEGHPDLVLLDVELPGVNGFDVCRALRTSQRGRDLPIVIVTASADPRSRRAAFEAGADDFVLKPFVAEELLARVRLRAEGARRSSEAALRDPTTGLLPRSAFYEALCRRVDEARRESRPLTIALIDVDRFAAVNERHGYLAGDRVLGSLGGLLSRRFPAEDLRGRWGGDQLTLALPGESIRTAFGALARAQAEFAVRRFASENKGESFGCTFSAGLAAFPEDGTTPRALLRVAGLRLFRAQSGGQGLAVAEG